MANVVIDNSDVDFTADGTWHSSTGVPGYYGGDYFYAYKGNGSLTATWTYQVTSSGGYENVCPMDGLFKPSAGCALPHL